MEYVAEIFFAGFLLGFTVMYFLGSPEDFYYHYKEHKHWYYDND